MDTPAPDGAHPAIIDVVAADLMRWQPPAAPEAGGDLLAYAYWQSLRTAVTLRRTVSQRNHHLCPAPVAATLADLVRTVGDLHQIRRCPPPQEPGPDGLFNAYQDTLMLACSLRFELCDRQGLRCQHTPDAAGVPTL
jgi:hypothetical protein